MSVKLIKSGVVFGVVLLLVGGAVSKQQKIQQETIAAADTTKLLKLAEKRGLYKVPPGQRQHAIAWALMQEINKKAGKTMAAKIGEARTPSELHAYLQLVHKTCRKRLRPCPVTKAVLGGFDANAKGIQGKHYGQEIATAAKKWEQGVAASGSSCEPEPAPSCGVFECLHSWGTHIGPCDAECGGLPGRFCPDEGDTDIGGDSDSGSGDGPIIVGPEMQ